MLNRRAISVQSPPSQDEMQPKRAKHRLGCMLPPALAYELTDPRSEPGGINAWEC